MSAAQNEATRETVTLDYFGRSWTLPAKARFSHLEAVQRNPSDVGIVLAFVKPEEMAAFRDIDPDADDLDKFTDAILAAVGLKSAGNS